jgi:hypothetical protein
MSLCCLGGIRPKAAMRRLVSSKLEVLAMASSALDNDYKLSIGELVIEAGKLDTQLTDIIIAVSGMGILPAMIFIHNQGFSQKLTGLTAMFRIIYPDDTDSKWLQIKELLEPELRRSTISATRLCMAIGARPANYPISEPRRKTEDEAHPN